MDVLLFLFLFSHAAVQITKIVGSTSIRHRSDSCASDRYLIDIDPTVFAIWVMVADDNPVYQHPCDSGRFWPDCWNWRYIGFVHSLPFTCTRSRSCVPNHQRFNCLFNSLCMITKKIKALNYWSFVSWIHRSMVASAHKGPVTRKVMTWRQHERNELYSNWPNTIHTVALFSYNVSPDTLFVLWTFKTMSVQLGNHYKHLTFCYLYVFRGVFSARGYFGDSKQTEGSLRH